MFEFRFPHIDAALGNLLQREVRPVAEAVEVFYDAGCPVCRGEIDHYRRIARANAVAFEAVDIPEASAALAPYRLDTTTLKRRLHVRDANGTVHAGVDAFIALWQTLPGYRWLAWAARLPVVGAAAQLLYEGVLAPMLVAWNRRRDRRRDHATSTQN